MLWKGCCQPHVAMSRILHDAFFKQAKKEGYIARSAYKLMEIQRKHKVIPTGDYAALGL